ncbi:hypothetical protein B0T26DRAFT_780401 [Lasiosphaeria miniovina]|uniref:Tyrosinase copper-binding domain-containing protein n=1 Tax=Lasiosphaeria miniovina TaxID=1954250 RepID=A0AA40DQU3_9PEZI|nr:uncharacterized protein B0T26DRAFT_780401 [Lasiosphaeria miniovina]KAK0712744.1 hypothetical protein B0T26DRAFT_780401 [Lasiosphaeria miniovina]
MMLLKPILCLTAALSASATILPSWDQLAVDSGLALAGLNGIALLSALGNFGGGCTPANVKIRQEWRTLAPTQRKNYISAAKCIIASGSLFTAGQVPGSFSLFDDFVWVHLNQTLNIHLTGTFLTWHRYYIHVYEQKLKACGYTGNLPYWEWGLDVNSPRDSPIFDGSDTSLGSDGAAVSHPGLQLQLPAATSVLPLPPGTGGGCVYKGPFKDITLHLGPVALPIYGSLNFTSAANPSLNNPRCLKRDLNPYVLKRYSSFRNTTDLITGYNTVELFQAIMQGDGRYLTYPSLGVHGGGHFTMGGDPGADPFISPNDPAFFLHHGQIDRVFWIWQMLDFANRQGVSGTNTFLNFPPSANTTVNDLIDIAPLSTDKPQIKSLMNTVGGTPFCYVYI